MPSVGMRRITRVFGARVLRSGRRMFTEPHIEWKYVRAANGGNGCIDLLEGSSNGREHAPEKKSKNIEPKKEESEMSTSSVMVYKRKRKIAESTSDGHSEDKRFGKKFSRRQWNKELYGNLKLRKNYHIRKTRSSLRRKKGDGETLASELLKIRQGRGPPPVVIPVPGVKEVSCPVDSNAKYVRPDSYINMEYDELTRSLMKKTANYDMDSDDEKWLNKLNDKLRVTPEIFESVIDMLEKGFHCNPDDCFTEKRKSECVSCMRLERKEVVEAIFDYWIKKRKRKRAALARVFQVYQPRKIQVIPRCIVQKKRSFRRHGRGKQQTFLQAQAVTDRCELTCIAKRERAQVLMENADLATYKAMMALKIAEAAQDSNSPGIVSSFLS